MGIINFRPIFLSVIYKKCSKIFKGPSRSGLSWNGLEFIQKIRSFLRWAEVQPRLHRRPKLVKSSSGRAEVRFELYRRLKTSNLSSSSHLEFYNGQLGHIRPIQLIVTWFSYSIWWLVLFQSKYELETLILNVSNYCELDNVQIGLPFQIGWEPRGSSIILDEVDQVGRQLN